MSIIVDVGRTELPSQDYVYKDITKTVKISADKRDITVSKDVEAVQNSISNIFTFRKGERIIQPEFGNSLYKYLYEPINELTSKKLGTELLNVIERWEPRVEIENIFVDPYPDENKYQVSMKYTIPSLNEESYTADLSIYNQ